MENILQETEQTTHSPDMLIGAMLSFQVTQAIRDKTTLGVS